MSNAIKSSKYKNIRNQFFLEEVIIYAELKIKNLQNIVSLFIFPKPILPVHNLPLPLPFSYIALAGPRPFADFMYVSQPVPAHGARWVRTDVLIHTRSGLKAA